LREPDQFNFEGAASLSNERSFYRPIPGSGKDDLDRGDQFKAGG